MKRILAALTLALLCSVALAVSAANATHSDGQGPKQSFAQGSMKFTSETFPAQIHVNAKDEIDPQGHWFIRQEGPGTGFDIDARGDVTCLRVDGNRAIIGGVVTQSNLPSVPVGRGVVIEAVDNGEPGDADQARAFFVPSQLANTCPDLPSTLPFQQGNFVIHDAP
jgi:hypothetical protein